MLLQCPTPRSNFDFQKALARRMVFDDGHIAMLKVVWHRLVGSQASVSHEQHVVVHLLGVPLIEFTFQVVSVLPCCRIELFVFLRAKPRPVGYLALRFVGGREIGHMRYPLLPIRCLKHEPQRADFVVQCAA